MAAPNAWPTPLCGCFEDCPICCYGFWCPCCLAGSVAERASGGRDSCCLTCCLYYLLAHFYLSACVAKTARRNVREAHGLGELPCGDCCVHCWCGACALCQEARALKIFEAAAAASAKGQFATAAPAQQMMLASPGV